MTSKKNKKDKPVYLKVRVPLPVKTGGAHQPKKGGKHNRRQEKQKTRKEIQTEL